MELQPAIEFIKINASDSTRLIALKSRYNRLSGRFNLLRLNGSEKEQRELLIQLTYLKSQIDVYE
jgi:hypothetical protein